MERQSSTYSDEATLTRRSRNAIFKNGTFVLPAVEVEWLKDGRGPLNPSSY